MLNPIEEAKFAELEKNCMELGVPAPPSIHINFEVADNAGNLIFKDRQRGHSWNRNFYNMMFSMLADCQGSNVNSFAAGAMSAKRTTGTIDYSPLWICTRPDNAITSGYGIINSGTTHVFGMQIGTGDTAFSAEQFALGNVIAAGTGAGQMSYVAQVAPVLAYDSTPGSEKWTCTQRRIMNNNSGGAIEVKETGLTYYGHWFGGYQTNYYLIERSVLSPTVTVPDGAQLTVTYDISMSFAAID